MYYYTLLIVFGFVAYFIATDESVAEYVNLFFRAVVIQLQRYYYMAILHPRNPITNWIMERKMKKLAREFTKKYNLKDDE